MSTTDVTINHSGSPMNQITTPIPSGPRSNSFAHYGSGSDDATDSYDETQPTPDSELTLGLRKVAVNVVEARLPWIGIMGRGDHPDGRRACGSRSASSMAGGLNQHERCGTLPAQTS